MISRPPHKKTALLLKNCSLGPWGCHSDLWCQHLSVLVSPMGRSAYKWGLLTSGCRAENLDIMPIKGGCMQLRLFLYIQWSFYSFTRGKNVNISGGAKFSKWLWCVGVGNWMAYCLAMCLTLCE